MSSILKGIKQLNEVNPHNYDSDWDYQDAVARSGRSRSRSSDSYDAHDAENDAYEMHKRFAATRARKEAEAKAAAEKASSEKLDELSPQTLASYKKKAGADASASDKRGDYARGNKRMSGIVKATKKEFANDSKGITEAGEWKDESNDYKEWSNHVKDALLSVGPSQQYGMAQRLSQIERKHFGSDIQTGFNAQTGKPDSTSSKDLTGTVSQIYSAIKSGALASAAPTAPGTQSTAFGTVTKPAGQPDPYHTSPALAGGDRQAALARLKGDSNYPAATTLRGPSSGNIKILRTEEDWEEALNNQDSGEDSPTTAAGFGAAMAKLPSWKVMLATIMLASKLPVIGDKIKNTIISSIKNEFGVQMSFKEALGYMQHVRTTPPEEIVSPAVWKFEKDGGDYETAIEQLPDEDVNVSPAHVMATISNDLISSGVAQEIKPGKEEKPTSGGAGAFGNIASQLTQKKEPVAEAMDRAVDSKGRTQDQWAQLVKSKFPGAKITQAKMIDGPMQATLPDGRKLYWSKAEQGVASVPSVPSKAKQGAAGAPNALKVGDIVDFGVGVPKPRQVEQGTITSIKPVPQGGGIVYTVKKASGEEVNLDTRMKSLYLRSARGPETQPTIPNGAPITQSQGVAEGLGKDIKRLATGKDVKSRAGQEIAKSQDASMKGDTKTSKKHFDRYDKLDKLANKEQGVAEEKQRLDPKCWTGKHKEGTKMKGGVRVNNCVPNEPVKESSILQGLKKV